MKLALSFRPSFCLALPKRALRGSFSSVTKGDPPSKRHGSSKEVTRSDELKKLPTAEPARHIEVPDQPAPAGLETVEKWKSPTISDQTSIKTTRERYEERFVVADEINEKLEQAATDPMKVLGIVHKYQRKFDNMNAYNALGYIHACFNHFEKSHTVDKQLATIFNPIVNDPKFLELCNLLYRKSRSYPPNACIANVIRLLDLGVPFRTPVIYVYLSLLKQSINELTTTEALTLAKSIATFRSLRLPTALNAGIQALLQKQADEEFDRFAADLGSVNVHHHELNLVLLLRLFGDLLTPIVRNKVFSYVATRLIEPGTISAPNLVRFLATLNTEWVSSEYMKKCLLKLENSVDDLTVFDAAVVTRICLSFRRFNDPLVLKGLTEMMNKKLNQCSVADEDLFSASRLFLLDLVKLNFAAPALYLSLITKMGSSSLSKELGISEFLEATVTHLHGNSEAMAKAVVGAELSVDWNSLNQRSKLIFYLLKNFYKIDVPILPKTFPSGLDQIEEMLATVTSEGIVDVTERLNVLPQMLSFAKLSGLQIRDHDLVLRMFISAIEQDLTGGKGSKGNKKLFIVPVGSSDFYQNRFDVIWTCRLRFFLLQRFLSGSDHAISVVPINLMRFRSLTSEREKFNYVRECLTNKGDRDLLELLL